MIVGELSLSFAAGMEFPNGMKFSFFSRGSRECISVD